MTKSITRSLCVFLSLFIGAGSLAFAQPWMNGLSESGGSNFYDIQRSFNRYWEGKDHTEKGRGWKAFKRWEWFWEQRVYPSGEFPNPMQLYNETQRMAATRGKSNKVLTGTWTEMGPSQSVGGYSGLGRVNCVRTAPANSNIIYVGTPAGGLWKSTNAGTTWTTNTDELPSLGVTDVVIDPTDPNIIYIATGDGDGGDTYSVGVMKSTDGGTTWNLTGLNWTTSLGRTINRLLMHPSDPNILLAAGTGIYKTTNGGTTWTQPHASSHKDMEFKPGDPTVVYASTGGGTIRRSTNTGDTWTNLSGGLPTTSLGRVALGVTPTNPEYLYALYASNASNFRGFYRSTNSGTAWEEMATTPNILGYEPDGSGTSGQGSYDLAITVSETDANQVFIGGVNNWRTDDGGYSWNIISMWYGGTGIPEVHADQHDWYTVPGTSTRYVGNDGGIYRTTNDGMSWTWLGNGLKTTQLYKLGLSATNANVIIAGAQDNGTKVRQSGGTWIDAIGGDGMESAVDYTNANIMYGTLYYGDIFRSANGGSSFSVISNPVTESGAWITPFALHPTTPTTIFAGYVNVWKTTNSGSTWAVISSIGSGTLRNLVIAPSNPQVIYISRSSTLRRTTDGGTTWPVISTPTGAATVTALAIHPTNPDVVWATSSGYSAGNKVWKSTNGGTGWTNISGTLPNVPANTIVYQNSSPDRVYVGTDIGVYYRDLNTPGWQDFNTGLPNTVISELEIQYSSGKIRAATYGRGIWESPIIANSLLASTPDSIVVSIIQGDSTTSTLQISNNGTAALTWSTTTLDLPLSWLSLSPASGTINPENSQNVTVKIKAIDTIGATQQGIIAISSNDPLANPKNVLVKVHVLTPYVSVNIPVASNWNLVSVPLRLSDYLKSSVFPTSTTQAFSYQGTYTAQDTLRNEPGYWLKFPAAENIPLTGLPLTRDTVNVSANWNLIGSIGQPVPVSAITTIGTTLQSPFFGYTATGYATEDTLTSGLGYWVKVSTSGKLVLKPSSPNVFGENQRQGASRQTGGQEDAR